MKEDNVFHKMRVASPCPPPTSSKSPRFPSSSNSNSRRGHYYHHHHQQRHQTHKQRIIVFNGISANSWLFPIGINHKDAMQAKEEQDKRGKVKENCSSVNLCGASRGGDAKADDSDDAQCQCCGESGNSVDDCPDTARPKSGRSPRRPTMDDEDDDGFVYTDDGSDDDDVELERHSFRPRTEASVGESEGQSSASKLKPVKCLNKVLQQVHNRNSGHDHDCAVKRDHTLTEQTSADYNNVTSKPDSANNVGKDLNGNGNSVIPTTKSTNGISPNRAEGVCTDNTVKNTRSHSKCTCKHSDRNRCETTDNEVDADSNHVAQDVKSSKVPPITPEEFDSIWERVSQRPPTVGKVFIVRRQKPPEGIGLHEYIQGQRLPSRTSRAGGEEEEEEGEGFFANKEEVFQFKRRPFTAPRTRKVKFSAETPVYSSLSHYRTNRPLSHLGLRRGEYGIHAESAYSSPVPFTASEDLTVTSLSLSGKSENGAESHSNEVALGYSWQSHNAQKSGSFSSRPKTATSPSRNKDRLRQHDQNSVDTIEGIKRSYMCRAASAPPGKIRCGDGSPHSSLQAHDGWVGAGASNGKPTLYWRAKSAYHKKLMAYEPEDEDIPVPWRGSLWRPLMMTDDDSSGRTMQHSAGCPYKCKGCFKACLVSEDYLEKARTQKLLKEKEQARQVHHHAPVSSRLGGGGGSNCRPPSVSKYRAKVQDPQNLISIALAKSQPLYQLVHGKDSEKNFSSLPEDQRAGDDDANKARDYKEPKD